MARVAKITKTIALDPLVSQATVAPKRTLPIIVVLTVLLLLAVGIAGYFYYQYRNTAAVAETKEIADLTKEIGKVFLLPEGETPTLATVTDREKLADQPFFQKSENGDKVLIYSQGGRAILYRPSTKKIVDVTTVNVNNQTQGTPVPPSDTAPVVPVAPASVPIAPEIQNVRVALYNGSTKIGVTNTLEDEIKAKFANVDVVTKDKAAKNDYQNTLVIDLSGSNADLAKSLAESFAGTVGTLPEGETAPIADILVIVGNK